MATGYTFNWVVLLLAFAGIAIVGLMIYLAMSKSSKKPVAPSPPVVEAIRTAAPAMPPSPVFVELTFDRGGPPEHVQIVKAGRPEFIGTESFPDMGKRMPVRYAEIMWRAGAFYIRPMDRQNPVRVRELNGAEFEIPMGQSAPLHHGMILRLEEGWTVLCKIGEEQPG